MSRLVMFGREFFFEGGVGFVFFFVGVRGFFSGFLFRGRNGGYFVFRDVLRVVFYVGKGNCNFYGRSSSWGNKEWMGFFWGIC